MNGLLTQNRSRAMFTYQDYLNFNSESDAEKQAIAFEKIQLSYDTLMALEKLSSPQEWIILAEPFCPDCQVFVPIVEKMARYNPLLKLRYVPRYGLGDRKFFDNTEQQRIIQETHSIPSAFLVNDTTTVIYQEFPTLVKEKMAQYPENYQMLRYAYREGGFTDLIEKQLIDFLLKV